MTKKVVTISLIMVAFCLMLTLNATATDTKTESPDVSKTDKMKAASIEPVNINKADVKTLATLKGIGKDRAQKIIEYREKNGPFQKPEDLMKVKGIGKKIFDQNKDFILI
jgi:competence protein ComEA